MCVLNVCVCVCQHRNEEYIAPAKAKAIVRLLADLAEELRGVCACVCVRHLFCGIYTAETERLALHCMGKGLGYHVLLLQFCL